MDKIPCLEFYIHPSWDHRPHKVKVALPDDWDESENKEVYGQELFMTWLNSQVEDSGWKMSRAYADELDAL